MQQGYFEKPALSKSQIKRFSADNPLEFWRNSPLNPAYKPDAMTDAMAQGKLSHLLTLEPQNLAQEFLVRDDLGKSRKNKAWQAAQAEAVQTIVNTEEVERATAMATAISQYQICRDLLTGIRVEREYCWHDKKYGIDCKAKLDAIKNTKEGMYIIDYKTTGQVAQIERFIDRGGFQFDVGFYSRAAEVLYGKKPVKFFFLIQSNKDGEENLIKIKCVQGPMLDACYIATESAINQIVDRYKRWKSGDKTAWLPDISIQDWEISPWLDREIADGLTEPPFSGEEQTKGN
jgi:hypothetical protein